MTRATSPLPRTPLAMPHPSTQSLPGFQLCHQPPERRQQKAVKHIGLPLPDGVYLPAILDPSRGHCWIGSMHAHVQPRQREGFTLRKVDQYANGASMRSAPRSIRNEGRKTRDASRERSCCTKYFYCRCRAMEEVGT